MKLTALKLALPITLLAAALLCGCAEQKTVEAQANYRRSSMGWAANSIVTREKRTVPDLANDANYIAWRIDHDTHQTNEDLILIGKYIQQDVDHFIKRQPDYRREIDRQLRGQPEKIAHNAIILFY